MMDRNGVTGSLLGLALGDALGAPYEGGPLEQGLWWLIGKTRPGQLCWTDDTQMALDLAESLLAEQGLQPDALARRFAASYRWHRGYGPGAARLLKRIKRGEDWRQANRAIYPDGSYGNGAAMRAPVIGLYYVGQTEALIEAARLSAQITHAHPLAIDGAVLIALATSLALASVEPAAICNRLGEPCQTELFQARLTVAEGWLRSGVAPEPAEVVARLGHGIAASESVVTAIYLGFRFIAEPFLEMQQFIVRCGGDVDTIGAMAGAIWGAARGLTALPAEYLERLEQRQRLVRVAAQLADRLEPAGSKSSG